MDLVNIDLAKASKAIVKYVYRVSCSYAHRTCVFREKTKTWNRQLKMNYLPIDGIDTFDGIGIHVGWQ